ncbi:glutamyl aminopeptidase [Nephila pilipes]|uniref:glutamyl aminopeptidase n=1 Tax=Nephila pilipes TaxID=299642 RepID=A0A8X6KKK6_NEPPI|nr:glutamyl aminopeptidase [Nephila pilipes]
MGEVFVSKTSCILSVIIFILLVLCVGLLVFVLKGKAYSQEEEQNLLADGFTYSPSPHIGGKTATPSLNNQLDSTHEATLPEEAPWRGSRLSKFVLPEHYDLQLQPNLTTDVFIGTVNITITVNRETKHFVLHVHKLTITDARLYDVEQDVKVNIDVQFSYLPNEYYVVQTENKVKTGKYKLYFGFTGSLSGSIVGFYKSRYKNSKNETRYLATSKFQPTYARRAFPCFDEPSFKSTFTVSLVHEKDYMALSNMPAESTEPFSNTNLYVTKFQKSVPMVTYLACFIVCDFQFLSTTTSSGKPFRVFSAPHLVNMTAYAVESGTRVLNYFENYFGISYPLPKMDMIAIPDFSSGAMENWGIITYRETNLIYDPEKSSFRDQQGTTAIIAHEMAHMWFGNLVTMEWWDDIWLNEGFATYIKYKGVDHQYPEWNELSSFIINDLQSIMKSDSWVNSHPIQQPVSHPDEITEIFDRISYAKGASILRMLEFFVGEKNFRTGVSNFLKKHEYKNAKTADLWEELSNTCGFQGNRSIASIMKTWTEQMGLPYVTVRRSQNSTTFVAKQKRFLQYEPRQKIQVESPHKYIWSIPLSYTTSDGKSGIVWIHDDKETEFNLPNNDLDWVKFNVNQTGYYLVNYEEDDWKQLTDLLLTNPEVLSPEDRSNLLFDSFLLSQAGIIETDIFLTMTTYLKKETHQIPWRTASSSLRHIAGFLEDTEAKLLLQGYIIDLTQDLYKKLGWESLNNYSDNLLRVTIINLACYARNQDCLYDASVFFRNWTQGAEIPPNLRNIVLTYGMQSTEKEADWNDMWSKYLAEKSPSKRIEYLMSLGKVKQSQTISKYLEYTLDETKVRSQDFFIALNSMINNPDVRSLVWNFIREKWPILVERFTLNNRIFGSTVKFLCSLFTTEKQLQEMLDFFSKYPDAGAGKRGRLQALEAVQYNIHWIKTHLNGIKNWLEIENPAPWYYHRLPLHIVPEHYDLTLHPVLDSDIFYGTVAITVRLTKPSRYFLVHSVKLNVSKTEVISDYDNRLVELGDVFEFKENNYLVLKARRKLPVGKYKLYFEFQGPFVLSLEGLYKSSYVNPDTKERRYLATTQFESIHARKAFPCFDEPMFKTTFNVSIIHDTEHFALSNTIVESISEQDNNLYLTRFEKTVPMVTYLLCIIVCDYKYRETITENGVRLRVYTAPHFIEKTYYSLDIGSKILTGFEKYFDVPFPLKKLDMIAIPDYGSNGMENWGLITYSEPSLISENVSNVDSKLHISDIVAHELAHMWFGDLVTMKWWSDLWLNEGFASYMSIKGTKLVEPDIDRDEDVATSFLTGAMQGDQTVNSHPIVQPVIHPNSEIFDSVTYSKGSTVLRMLEHYMGEDFRKGVSAYLKKYAFKNTETEDLWNELSAASKQGLNVKELMDTWTKQMNFPLVTVKKIENSSSNEYTLKQQRFLSNPETKVFAKADSPFNYVWQIPLTYYTADSKEVKHLFLNSSQEVNVTLPASRWIKFNVDFTGYYLVRYDKKSWETFIEILLSDHTVFSPADRLNLVFEAFSLASAGHLPYSIPFSLIRYLKKEEYHGVWATTLHELSRIKWFFRGDKEIVNIIHEYVRHLSNKLYKKYSWNDSEDFSERKLRKIIIKAACASENQDCLQTASRLFGECMKGAVLSSEIKGLVYEYGLRVRNNDEAWNFLWNRYIEENDPYEKLTIIAAMTTISNVTLLEKLMENAKNQSVVRKHDYLGVMDLIAHNSKGFPLVTRLIYKNWTKLVKTYDIIEASEFASGVFSKYHSQLDLEQVRLFYKENKAKEGSRLRTLAIEEINGNIHWNIKHHFYVQFWLETNIYMPWKKVRLPQFIVPIRYDILLHPNISDSTFQGEETIELDITEDTDYIPIHETKLNITKVEVRGLISGEEVAIEEAFPFKKNEYFVIRFEEKIPRGLYRLKFVFSGKFSTVGKGLGRYQYIQRETKEVRYMIATQFEATFARKVFPCFDEPAMKAKFKLSIVHDSNHNAVSNMPEETRESLGNNLSKTVFVESATMSTYLLFFSVSDFEQISSSYKQTQVRVFAPSDRLDEARHGLNLTVRLLGSFEEYFGVPYSLPKLDSVVIVNYSVPAMEHWGVISYNAKRFMVDDKMSTYKRISEVDRVIAHEIVHQWFGNLVTMKWWNDVWLNEGLSTLVMYIPLKQYYTAMDGLDTRKISRVMCMDSNTDSHPVVRSVTTPEGIANIFDAISYEKGSAVLKMLQHVLKEDFRKGLSNYLRKYAFSNAETNDLWRELSEASTENINVTEIMESWIDQMGFPYVELKRNGGTVAATQHWFVRDINDTVAELVAQRPSYSRFGFIWNIPLVYKNIRTGEEHTVWLKDKNATFQIEANEDDVVHFNPGFVGFYVVKYDSLEWAKHGKRLLSNHTDFTATDRYSLLHDAFLLAETDRLIYDIPFELTKYLRREKEPILWSFFRDQYLFFMNHLDPKSEAAKLLKIYVADLTSTLYDDHVKPTTLFNKSSFKKWKSTVIGCTYTVPDLDFESLIIDLACRTSNPECLKATYEELLMWSQKQNITADLHFVFEIAIAHFGDNTFWQFLYDEMTANDADENRKQLMAEGLVSFRDPSLIQKTINVMATDPKIDIKLAKFMYQNLINNPDAMPHLWSYSKQNWDSLMTKLNTPNNPSIWVSKFCEKFKTKEWREELSMLLVQVEISEYIERGCYQDIQEAIDWLDKYEEPITTWLVWNVKQ